MVMLGAEESARECNVDGAAEHSDLCIIEYDLGHALQALQIIRYELTKPNDQQNQLTIEMNWTGAIIKFCRCFEKSNGKTFHLKPSIFSGIAENGMEAFKFIKNHRNKAIVHDDSPFIQNQTVGVITPDRSSFGIGNFMMTGVIDRDYVVCLGQLCEIAIKHVKAKKEALEQHITRKVSDLGGLEWLLKQPEARLVVPGGSALAKSRKDWTRHAAANSRKGKI